MDWNRARLYCRAACAAGTAQSNSRFDRAHVRGLHAPPVLYAVGWRCLLADGVSRRAHDYCRPQSKCPAVPSVRRCFPDAASVSDQGRANELEYVGALGLLPGAALRRGVGTFITSRRRSAPRAAIHEPCWYCDGFSTDHFCALTRVFLLACAEPGIWRVKSHPHSDDDESEFRLGGCQRESILRCACHSTGIGQLLTMVFQCRSRFDSAIPDTASGLADNDARGSSTAGGGKTRPRVQNLRREQPAAVRLVDRDTAGKYKSQVGNPTAGLLYPAVVFCPEGRRLRDPG